MYNSKPNKVDSYAGERLTGAVLSKLAIRGNYRMLELLLKTGINPDSLDFTGYTVLANIVSVSKPARSENQARCLELVIKYGANVNMLIGKETSSPLIEAAIYGYHKYVEKLLMAGADVNRKVNGYTPLLAAALHNNPDCIKILLSRGADVTVQGEHGYTALMYAGLSNFGLESNKIKCILTLLEAGANQAIKNTNGEVWLDTATQSIRDWFLVKQKRDKAGKGLNVAKENKSPAIDMGDIEFK